ncbi:hypothetical protein CC2G_000216 [Coprinopsis cinerea AmutBmut pab1-1]|nr:hypothetical protein CC2G_000216 [Coprinopsis cinerea AmutBmut pab1-1]
MTIRLCNVDVPLEVIEHIAFSLVASEPLGNPSSLLPFFLTSRSISLALSLKSRTTLYARICRLKFDVGAVSRRAFSPHTSDLNDHLVQMCQLLQFIRRGDIWHEDAIDYLIPAFIAMLDNDGKNRAQLEDAGIESFLDDFVMKRLHEGKELNDMWPLENPGNACALWLYWMFTTPEKVESETQPKRKEILRLLLPYIVCPYRYVSAYAPATHSILPLGDSNPIQKQMVTIPTAHGLYPIYHTERQGSIVLHHFRSSTPILLPPISAAAKLLYWCRHEVSPFFAVPSHLPLFHSTGAPEITQEILHEFNRSRVAKLPEVARWDWDQGTLTVNGVRVKESGQTRPSQRWDMDWWRMRMCRDVFYKQPRWRLGHVYMRGLLSGVWHGVYFLVNEPSIQEMLRTSRCPADLSSSSLAFMPQPMVMKIQEHGFVRIPPVQRSPSPISIESQSRPIPFAEPQTITAWVDVENQPKRIVEPVDRSLSNAWFPGAIGNLHWVRGPDLEVGPRDPMALPAAHGEPRLRPANESTRFFLRDPGVPHPEHHTFDSIPASLTQHHVYETYDPKRESMHERLVDASRDPKLFHLGCLRCADRESYLAARRARDWSEARRLAEDTFASVGLGFLTLDTLESESDEDDEGGGVVDLRLDMEDLEGETSSPLSECFSDDGDCAWSRCEESSEEVDEHEDAECGHPGVYNIHGNVHYGPLRRSHDRYRVEECDGGVEDTVVASEPDATRDASLGYSIYYGRVRRWDGLVAILKQQILGERIASLLFYGYIYGQDNFVGNWRYAGTDPLLPSFESCFIMSKKRH